jgi:hypothetical protein
MVMLLPFRASPDALAKRNALCPPACYSSPQSGAPQHSSCPTSPDSTFHGAHVSLRRTNGLSSALVLLGVDLPRLLSHLIIPRNSHMPKNYQSTNKTTIHSGQPIIHVTPVNTFVFYSAQQTICQISTQARRVQFLLYRSFFFSPGKSYVKTSLVSLPLRTLERKSAGNQR